MGDRVILHCDLNCFFASVELLDKPALWEVPVAVCGDPKSRHGIILAKNEPAKRCGVQTAVTSAPVSMCACSTSRSGRFATRSLSDRTTYSCRMPRR